MPLGTGRQVTGALTLVRTDPARPCDTGDLDVASNIGRRVGPVIDNARRFGRRREVAEAMQRNLLPALPEHGRIQLAARYQPAPAGSQVGGDWYDAFPLRDGALALVIGDVVGHDLTAAAGMAQTHLGVGSHRPSAARALPPGSTLLPYTDGLIEAPGSDLDSGLGRLRRHALALAHEPLHTLCDQLCDQLSARMPPGSTDDIALLALRLPVR
ncbi:PP2C family protein-serine/threonine phosphatase [Streptomyces sp. NPDC003998]